MPTQKAKIIPEPSEGTRTILAPPEAPAIRGDGDLTILCGACNIAICQNIIPGQVENIVVKCPNCGKFNDI